MTGLRFDREAPGNGAELYCTLENGKAVLEWKFYYTEEGGSAFVKLLLYDREGTLVFEGGQPAGEEELLRAVLLHPKLWNSIKEPYLYRAELSLVCYDKEHEKECDRERERTLDRLSFFFPVRSLKRIPGKGWLLNGEAFPVRAVRFEGTDRLSEYLAAFRQAGVNTVCVSRPWEQPPFFYEACDRQGFAVWTAGLAQEAEGRLFLKGNEKTELFYQCRAMWTEEPFVYLSLESLSREPDGSFCITVYSNQQKAALYVNGALFEFQRGEREFVFRGICFEGLFLCLTAEAGECAMSLTIHRTFTKTSLFHDNYRLK